MISSVWITGVAGFTGRYLVDYLSRISNKIRITGFDIADNSPPGLHAYHQIDLNKSKVLRELAGVDRPTHVIHLAAVMPPADEAYMWHVNAGGTVNLLHALAKAGCNKTRVVITGSAAEYLKSAEGFYKEDSPSGGETRYGRTKWSQTVLALEIGKQMNIPVMIARTFNLIGPGLPKSLVVGELCDQFAQNKLEEIVVGNVISERDFVDVRDAVAAYWMVMQRGDPGEIYNVCCGKATSIVELISIFATISGRKYSLKTDSKRFKDMDLNRVYGDNAKITKATGWLPQIALEQSLRDMLDGYIVS